METKSIKVDEQTHHDLKVLAALRRITIADLVAGLVKQEMEQEKRKRENFGSGPIYKSESKHDTEIY